EFRDALGNCAAGPSTGLKLKLKNFGPDTMLENADAEEMSQLVSIPSSMLYEFMLRVERDASKTKDRKGKMVDLKPGARKRRRPRTPPEELKSDHERSFLEQEARDAKRSAKCDDDYEE
ncbi:hypothetical protein B0A49_14000, partial [Cryomyces minteri]